MAFTLIQMTKRRRSTRHTLGERLERDDHTDWTLANRRDIESRKRQSLHFARFNRGVPIQRTSMSGSMRNAILFLKCFTDEGTGTMLIAE
jgi:hypothetical protein